MQAAISMQRARTSLQSVQRGARLRVRGKLTRYRRVLGSWIGELASKLGGYAPALAMLVGVTAVDLGRGSRTVTVGQRHDVEVVPRLVSLHDQETLDPQRLLGRRCPQRPSRWERDLRSLQRSRSSQLGTPASMSTEDDLPRRHPVRHPLTFGLERFQHDVEPVAQIRDDAVVVVRVPVTRVEGSRGAANENRIRDKLLQSCSGLQHLEEQRAGLGKRVLIRAKRRFRLS